MDIENNELKNSESIEEISCIESIEDELKSSNIIKDKMLLTTEIEEINIENQEIFNNIKFNEKTDLELFTYQLNILNNIKKNLKDIQKEILIEYIDWLRISSKYLSDKIGLQIFYHKYNLSDNNLPRSSYKFCNFNYECKKDDSCYAQHYATNLVYADTDALYHFIKFKDIIDENFIDEIKKTINTLHYVINHMYEELKNSKSTDCIERTPKKKFTCLSGLSFISIVIFLYFNLLI